MKINDIELYKVVEFDSGLIIMRADDSLQRKQSIDLIAAPMRGCCEYLIRYTEARAQGKHPRDAHSHALKGAKIIRPGHLDQPGVKVNGS